MEPEKCLIIGNYCNKNQIICLPDIEKLEKTPYIEETVNDNFLEENGYCYKFVEKNEEGALKVIIVFEHKDKKYVYFHKSQIGNFMFLKIFSDIKDEVLIQNSVYNINKKLAPRVLYFNNFKTHNNPRTHEIIVISEYAGDDDYEFMGNPDYEDPLLNEYNIYQTLHLKCPLEIFDINIFNVLTEYYNSIEQPKSPKLIKYFSNFCHPYVFRENLEYWYNSTYTKFLLKHIFISLHKLHRINIFHHDLHKGNIWIKDIDDDMSEIKFIDFGVSCSLYKTLYNKEGKPKQNEKKYVIELQNKEKTITKSFRSRKFTEDILIDLMLVELTFPRSSKIPKIQTYDFQFFNYIFFYKMIAEIGSPLLFYNNREKPEKLKILNDLYDNVVYPFKLFIATKYAEVVKNHYNYF